jgi:UDP-N-acetylglucosamine--N-acetylmuramyl-(pentapeptide) pyrophosphoryl-undecaprenol N-acetylglucosamine transferase
MKRYAIACGGTGGHLAPGLAVVEALTAGGDRCVLIVSGKNVDGLMLEKYGDLRRVVLPIRPFRRRWSGLWEFAKSQLAAFIACVKLIRAEKIDCVVGMGGFASVPPVLAAFLLRKKIVLHEANRIVGKGNRLLAWIADIIFLPEGVSFGSGFLRRKTIHGGLPLRREMRRMERGPAREKFGLSADGFVLTVIGGSQGSAALNGWALENLHTLNDAGIAVCCVRGVEDADPKRVVEKSADGQEVVNVFLPFCDDMPSLLSASDLLVSRAGAGTIAEAMWFSLPMVLVPYPEAADNHQEANANHAERAGMAVVVRQGDNARLTEVVLESAKNSLKNFHGNAMEPGEASASDAVVEHIRRLVDNG